MKTPEEIKKGLECCSIDPYHCGMNCPYVMDCHQIGTVKTLEKDALAYIQQLEKQIPRWISVKERLPENDDDVLIITEFGISMGCYVIHRDFWVYYTNPDSNIVTHWMPMPEAPRE